MEQKGLRYETQRIHLGGDPREPPKQPWYLREVAPRGNVPALRIGGDEVVLESLDTSSSGSTPSFPAMSWRRTTASSRRCFRRAAPSTRTATDGHNTHAPDEAALRGEALQKLTWLEEALRQHGGPFFLGAEPSIVDAAFVGFLTRLAVNYKFFKGLDVHEVGSAWPRLSAWLRAVERTPDHKATAPSSSASTRRTLCAGRRRSRACSCTRRAWEWASRQTGGRRSPRRRWLPFSREASRRSRLPGGCASAALRWPASCSGRARRRPWWLRGRHARSPTTTGRRVAGAARGRAPLLRRPRGRR